MQQSFFRILYLNPTTLQSLYRYRQCDHFRGFDSWIMRILNLLFAYVKQHSQFDQDQMGHISTLVNRSKIQDHIVIIPIKIEGTKLFDCNNFMNPSVIMKYSKSLFYFNIQRLAVQRVINLFFLYIKKKPNTKPLIS